MTPRERLTILEMPYLRPCDICRVIEKPRATVYKILKRSEIKKYPSLGYLTDDIIKAFQLQGAIKRWRAST